MSKTKMPEPVAEFRIDQLGNVREPFFTGETGNLYAGYYKAITTDQAEAYAQAVRREALEEVISLLESRFFKDQKQIENAIRALIPKETT